MKDLDLASLHRVQQILQSLKFREGRINRPRICSVCIFYVSAERLYNNLEERGKLLEKGLSVSLGECWLNPPNVAGKRSKVFSEESCSHWERESG